jgi:prepilin peptidase CpaA
MTILWINLALMIVLVICVYTDVRERKIYNKVLFPSLLFAIIFHSFSDGLSGLSFSIFGCLVGFSILLIPYFMGGMGAGDVKLLAVIGSFKGLEFVLNSAIYMALLGGLMALFVLLFHKGILARLKTMFYSIFGLKHGIRVPLFLTKESMKTTYPYGVPIAGGACISLLTKGLVIL